eukprot:g2152.t1
MASLSSSAAQWSTSLSDYSLCERIGRGAFADVYRAEVAGRSDGSAIALKVMDMEKIGSQVDDDIRAEVLTMKSCNHPNVLGCFACFTSSNANLYLVMPYMDRGSALHVMKRLKHDGKRAAGLSKGWVKYIIGEVLKGLQYLHDNKLIHRDIKAGNILLNSHGDVKIADFGTTTFMQERGRDRQHATFTGTVCWMAPEVMAQEEGYSYPADVWSIGITTLELVKGYAPYAMYAPMKVLLETLQKAPPTIKSYADEQGRKSKLSGTEWASKSSSFKKFVAACLKREPSDRSTIASLLGMKFVSHGKAGPEVARAMFARELCTEISDPLHVEKSTDSAGGGVAEGEGTNDDTGAASEKTEKPEWDFSDLLNNDGEGGEKEVAKDEGGDVAAAAASANVEKDVEINDDNFGDMFSAAGLGGL